MPDQDQYWDCDRCGEGYPLTSEYPPITLEMPDGEQEWICGGCAAPTTTCNADA